MTHLLPDPPVLLKLLPDRWTTDPRPLRSVGLLALVAGNAWPRFAPASLSVDVRDASQGFMMGVSIAILLWSLVIQKGARRS
jgi:hypothetical protein